MRTPTYLSYSALTTWEQTPDEFFLKYLSENRPGRLPQTLPMCVGSAFDAYVKSELHARVFGTPDPTYELQTLFESQVEEANRDFAWEAGAYCCEAYKLTGAFDELLALLWQSIEPPRFECSLTGEIGGAPFLGKPDCRFVLDLGEGRISVVLDWKVKSFCSKSAASPSKGYALCRDAYTGKASRSHGKSHPMYMPIRFRGMEINRDWMENSNAQYADQCSLYGWLLGEPVGSEETVVWIDELVAKPTNAKPLLRVANHRARVSKGHQERLEQRVATCWQAIASGHVFPEMTREESDARIDELNKIAIGLAADGSEEERFYNEATRPQFKR